MSLIRTARRTAREVVGLIDGTPWRSRPAPSPDTPVSLAYEQNGHIILRNALPPAAIAELVAAVRSDILTSSAQFRRHPSAAHEPHRFMNEGTGNSIVCNALVDPHREPETKSIHAAILNLICSENVADLLQSIDAAGRYTIHQTILFFVPPGTELHIDGWKLDTEPRGRAHTLWIPLEPVTLRNGPLAIVPWPQGKVLSAEMLGVRTAQSEDNERAYYHAYHSALNDHIREHHPDCVVPQLDPGDLVVFSSTTPHGTLPHHQGFPSRMAMQVLVRPSNLRWGPWRSLESGESSLPNWPPGRFSVVNHRWRFITS
jgi:ectoine hydroxylase-related dioxygenase (phytanoyl-CoA dioxygenase family)